MAARKSKDIAVTTANKSNLSKRKLSSTADELWKYLQHNNQMIQSMLPKLQAGCDGYNRQSPNPKSQLRYELLCLREQLTRRAYYQQSLEAKKWNLKSNIQSLNRQVGKLTTTLTNLNAQSQSESKTNENEDVKENVPNPKKSQSKQNKPKLSNV